MELASELVNQVEVINRQRLNNVVVVSQRTLDLLMHQVGDGVLTEIKGPVAYQNFTKNVEDIIIAKLRKKFQL